MTRRVIRQAVDLVFDLDGELARRREDEHARFRASVGSGVGQQPLQRRHDERRRSCRVPVSAQAMRSLPRERERNDRRSESARVSTEAEVADAFEQARVQVRAS